MFRREIESGGTPATWIENSLGVQSFLDALEELHICIAVLLPSNYHKVNPDSSWW